MNPTQLNKHQTDAVLAGSTKLFVPIDTSVHSINITDRTFESARNFPCDCGGVFPIAGCTDCYNKGVIFDLDCECEEEFILKYSPYQPKEQYFVQEEFTNEINVIYRLGGPYGIGWWTSANQMTEDQSRIKFTVADVEVKPVQELELRQMVAMGIKNETAMTERFVPWHDSQYPDQPYSTKPIGFLVSIERI